MSDCRIQMFLNCRKCVAEAHDAGQSPSDYSRYDVGWTGTGVQVWCRRHDLNIAFIDFEGQEHTVDARGTLTDEPHISGVLCEEHPPECECCKDKPNAH